MQFRFEIATVLYFTATLSVGCACGLAARPDGAMDHLVATETRHIEDNGHIRRAAVFREYGRYYK